MALPEERGQHSRATCVAGGGDTVGAVGAVTAAAVVVDGGDLLRELYVGLARTDWHIFSQLSCSTQMYLPLRSMQNEITVTTSQKLLLHPRTQTEMLEVNCQSQLWTFSQAQHQCLSEAQALWEAHFPLQRLSVVFIQHTTHFLPYQAGIL